MSNQRYNELGNEIIGEEPDCLCDGAEITLWDCPCSECRGLARDGYEDPEDFDRDREED